VRTRGLPRFFSNARLAPEVLDGIVEDVLSGGADAARPVTEQGPAETGTPGVFRLDLAALQAAHPEMSSKRALRAFWEQKPFIELRLHCDHIPPWIEPLGFRIVSERAADGKLDAVITHKTCEEAQPCSARTGSRPRMACLPPNFTPTAAYALSGRAKKTF